MCWPPAERMLGACHREWHRSPNNPGPADQFGWKPQEKPMNSPRALLISIAATACSFIIALVGIIGAASHAATPTGAVSTAPAIVSTVAQDVRHVDPVIWTLALEPVASH